MSYWTNVILIMSSYDFREYRWIIHKEIDKFCDFGRFEEVDVYGGYIFIGLFKSFHENDFKKWLLKLDWYNDSRVQLIIKGENDDVYKTWFIDNFNYEIMRENEDEN